MFSNDTHSGETVAQRMFEDAGFVVHNANIIFQTNCANIDLVVYAPTGALYVQVKSSKSAAGRDCIVVDGSPWTEDQLWRDAPIFNKHSQATNPVAQIVAVVDRDPKLERSEIYVIPPLPLENLLRKRGRDIANTPKRDGTRRSVKFRKELSRSEMLRWKNNWHQVHRALTNSPE